MIILVLFLCILIESTVLPFPITFLVAVALCMTSVQKQAMTIALITGVLLDLFLLRPLGVSALFLLSVVFLLSAYRKKIYAGWWGYRALFISLAVIGYTTLWYSISWRQSFSIMLISAIALKLVNIVRRRNVSLLIDEAVR